MRQRRRARPRPGGARLLGALLWVSGLAFLSHPALAQVNLLANGSFEEPRTRPADAAVALGPDSMPGWRVTDGSVALVPYSTWQPAVSQGKQTLVLGDASGPGSLEQSFPTRPGQFYLLSGFLARATTPPVAAEGRAQLSLNGQPLAPLVHSDRGATTENMRWLLFARRFQASSETTTLRISGTHAVLDGLAVTLAGSPTAPAPFFPIDLSQHLTHRLFDPMLGPGNDLIDLGDSVTPESPLRVLRGVPFLLDGVVLVAPSSLTEWPLLRRVEGIPVGRKAAHLHFLHANHYSEIPDGTRIGSYVVHYADGISETVWLRYGEDLADWWFYPWAQADAPVAWQGRNEAAARWDRATNFRRLVGRPLSLQLFLKSWTNPKPDVEIRSLDVVAFRAAGAPWAAPFLVAVTGD